MDAEEEIQAYLDQPENQEYKKIAEKTKYFLSGYYSSFGLELLSTVDFIKENKQKEKVEEILSELENWSDRKRTLFANPNFVNKALEHITYRMD